MIYDLQQPNSEWADRLTRSSTSSGLTVLSHCRLLTFPVSAERKTRFTDQSDSDLIWSPVPARRGTAPSDSSTKQREGLEREVVGGERTWRGSLQESTEVILCVVSVKTAQWHVSVNLVEKTRRHGNPAAVTDGKTRHQTHYCSVHIRLDFGQISEHISKKLQKMSLNSLKRSVRPSPIWSVHTSI